MKMRYRIIITRSDGRTLPKLAPCELASFLIESDPVVEEIDVTTILSKAKEYAPGLTIDRRVRVGLRFRGDKGYEYLRDSFGTLLTVTAMLYYPRHYSMMVGSFECMSLGGDRLRSRRKAMYTCDLQSCSMPTFATGELP